MPPGRMEPGSVWDFRTSSDGGSEQAGSNQAICPSSATALREPELPGVLRPSATRCHHHGLYLSRNAMADHRIFAVASPCRRRCRYRRTYKPFGCAFGARSALRAARLAGRDMRVDRGQTEQDREFRQYVRQAAASSPASTADQLAKLADLRDQGSSPPRNSSGRRPGSWRPEQLGSVGRMGG